MEKQHEHILALAKSGLSIIPIAEGEKRPHSILGPKHDLFERRASSEEVLKWIESGVTSWAVAGGVVSRNLITIDFDLKHYLELYDLWYAKLSTEQKMWIDMCYVTSTRNGGKHVRYLTQTPQPTVKLASRVELGKETGKEKIVTTAETRGQRSYALIPPSVGYTTEQGDLLELPIIPDDIHEELIDLLRIFNEVEVEPETEYEWKETEVKTGDRPGDRLNQLMSWSELLEPHGWKQEDKNRWIRPGKEAGQGISATTDYDGRPMFYVFSSSADPFRANCGYSKFSVFTLLNHGGDYSAAAKAAAELYPIEQVESRKDKEVTIEEIEEMLHQIPPETPLIKLKDEIGPILQSLIRIDKMTAEIFLLENVKEYFDINKGDARKFVNYLNWLRVEVKREAQEAKRQAERIPLIVDRDIDYQEVIEAISEIGIIKKELLDIIIAVVVSAKLRLNPPLWIFLIGVPSSFKTELVGLFSAMAEVYTLDTLTENAFASGYLPPDGSDPHDLLPELDNKAFIIKDLNTLFSMNEEMVKKILGDLTGIFDGSYEKFTATRGMIKYTSSFSMIGCVTPSMLIEHYNYATKLGPRFLFLRIPQITKEELNYWLEKSWKDKNRRENIIKARRIVSSYCTQLIEKIGNLDQISVEKEFQQKINDLAYFTAQARGIALTSTSKFKPEGKNEEISYHEVTDHQTEDPWRVLGQLKPLLKIISLIHKKTVVNDEEIKTIRPLILSTMPVDRAEVLSHLTQSCGLSAKDLSLKINKSYRTVTRTLKALEVLKIVDYYKDPRQLTSSKAPRLFFIKEEFANVLEAPIPSAECLEFRKANIGEEDSNDSDYDSVEDNKINPTEDKTIRSPLPPEERPF